MKFFPPEMGGEANTDVWLIINGFKECTTGFWAASQYLVAYWEAPWCLSASGRSACYQVQDLTNRYKRKTLGDINPGRPSRTVEGANKVLKRIIKEEKEKECQTASSSTQGSSEASGLVHGPDGAGLVTHLRTPAHAGGSRVRIASVVFGEAE